MTVHLFPGHMEGTAVVVSSGIAVCCGTHSLGLPKGDQGTIDPLVYDCPGRISADLQEGS